jgi:hypothetical protein
VLVTGLWSWSRDESLHAAGTREVDVIKTTRSQYVKHLTTSPQDGNNREISRLGGIGRVAVAAENGGCIIPVLCTEGPRSRANDSSDAMAPPGSR